LDINAKIRRYIMSDINFKEGMNILDKIYNARQYDFEQKANLERKELANKLNHVTIEEIEKIIHENIEEQHKKQELIDKLDKLIENYEIKMAYYMERRYKQGFKDGVNLLKQCEEK